MSPPRIVVAAAVVERDDAFLVTRRLRGTHLEGMWEFPGGKCAEGEDHAACLAREMREELAVDVDVHERMLAVTHEYPDRAIELHFYRCALRGEPQPQLGQDMQWVRRADLGQLELPPADAELIDMLSNRVPGDAKSR